jgi:hypothetical protein
MIGAWVAMFKHAGRGVLAEQRTLRAAQHFHARHVQHQAAGRRALRHAVDHHADRAFGRHRHHGGADAADRGAAARAAGRLLVAEFEGGRGARQVADVLDAGALELGRVDDGDCERHFLDALAALLRGHDHGLDAFLGILGGHRRGAAGVGLGIGGVPDRRKAQA